MRPKEVKKNLVSMLTESNYLSERASSFRIIRHLETGAQITQKQTMKIYVFL